MIFVTGLAINTGFALAALAALVTFCVHTFVGGRFAAAPLLVAPDLAPATRWLNYMTWHMVTALLAVMTIALGWSAFQQAGAVPVVVLLLVLSGLLSGVTIAVTLKAGIRPWRFPSSYLFLIILACALWGLGNPS